MLEKHKYKITKRYFSDLRIQLQKTTIVEELEYLSSTERNLKYSCFLESKVKYVLDKYSNLSLVELFLNKDYVLNLTIASNNKKSLHAALDELINTMFKNDILLAQI